MKRYSIEEIGFSSFMKLAILIGFDAGLVFAVLAFIGSIFGGDVSVMVGSNVYSGVAAGLLGFIVSPLSCALLVTVLGLLAFLPFKYSLKIKKKIGLNLRIKGE